MKHPILATLAAAALVAACGKEEPKKAPPPKPAPKVAEEPPALPPDPPEQVGTAVRRTDLPEPPPPPPVAVQDVLVGRAVTPDNKLDPNAGPITSKDTLHASVETQGAGRVALRAVVKHLGEGKGAVVYDQTQTVVTSGPATHVFKASKPEGWTAGTYQVEILVEERPAATRRFGIE